jgi:Pyruvate/2-oxoacid:ferredoxin oxidoreductase delta subunit
MNETTLICRRDFLKNFPKYLADHIQTGADEGHEHHCTDEAEGTKVAMLMEERCLAWNGNICQHCYLACPLREQAIRIDDQRPVIMPAFCNGCARCVTVCQTVNDRPAIAMIPART